VKYVGTREIRLAEIQTNEYHLREETDRKNLEGLARSIERLGLVHPIVVRATPEAALAYALVAGERRFVAHQMLDRQTIRADVWEATEEEAGEPHRFTRAAEVMTIVSNVQVEPLHLFEMGRRYIRWMEEFGMTEQDVAEALGVSPHDVTEAIRPLKTIAPEVLQLIEKNPDKILRRHIDVLADEARRTSPAGQMKIVEKIITQEDKELVQRPAKLAEVAVRVRREERQAEKARKRGEALTARAEHSDQFKRKKLFDFIRDAEMALSDFKGAEIPNEMSLVDLRSLEARGERLGRAWPEAVTSLIKRAESAAAAATAGVDRRGQATNGQEEPSSVRQEAKV
jgi:ParB/RepB/Spo0J family partition protein